MLERCQTKFEKKGGEMKIAICFMCVSIGSYLIGDALGLEGTRLFHFIGGFSWFFNAVIVFLYIK